MARFYKRKKIYKKKFAKRRYARKVKAGGVYRTAIRAARKVISQSAEIKTAQQNAAVATNLVTANSTGKTTWYFNENILNPMDAAYWPDVTAGTGPGEAVGTQITIHRVGVRYELDWFNLINNTTGLFQQVQEVRMIMYSPRQAENAPTFGDGPANVPTGFPTTIQGYFAAQAF